MNKFDYKNLSPFKWFVLENFPFIEADFDALTEWQLFCKIGKEINKIIDSQNIVGEQAENLTNAFNNLKNYVDNYFDNLDVQDEVNKKLNEMVLDGTFDKIINQDIFNELNKKIDTNTANITKNTNNITKNTNDIAINRKNTINRHNVHISWDDVGNTWDRLLAHNYDSIFEEPFLKILKNMHDKYNICFSLYVFSEKFNKLSNIDKYKNEFMKNSYWLKIGYHSVNGEDDISDNTTPAEFINKYNTFVETAKFACGDLSIIDRIPRLNRHMCSFPISTIFCETESPIIGVLANQRDSSVEGFNNYFNNRYMNDFLDKNYYYYNDVNCLFEFRSNFVLDNSTVSQVETDFYNALKQSFYIEIYGHETAITTTSGNVNADYLNVLEKVCQLINDNNLKSGYIQDNLPIINTKNYYFNDKTYATLFVNNFSPRNIIFPRNSQISTNIIPFKYFTVSGISTEKYACMTEAIDKAKTKKITISGNNSNLYRVGITQFRTHSMLLTNNNLNLEYNTFTPLSEKSTYELSDDTLMYVISFSLVDKTRTLTLDDIYNIQNLNYTIVE